MKITRIYLITVCLLLPAGIAHAQLKAGVAKANITIIDDRTSVNDSLFVKALVLSEGLTKLVIITVDAIVADEVRISLDYLTNVRSQLEKDLKISPANVMFNASHVHGAGYTVSPDVEQKTVQAVKRAWQNMVPVRVGAGKGYENRITENRRLQLKSGGEWTIRQANPLPPDSEVAGIGPVDPEIGILRLDKKNGETLAVLYNFACHPYMGVPDKSSTADVPAFASKVIEDNLSRGTMAFFLQGCAGDITPVLYKNVNMARNAEPLGTMLGLSTLNALRGIKSSESKGLKIIHETIDLPRRTDISKDIESLTTEQEKLLQSLRGTSLNMKTFIPLYIKYNLSPEYPSYYSHMYMHEESIGRNDFKGQDEENRRNMGKYISNITSMEKLARIQENLSLLKTRLDEHNEAGGMPIKVEIQAMKIGEFIMVTFPGEVFAEVGLNIKKMSPFKNTFVAAYSNGAVGYAPTSRQYGTGGYEDLNCRLAPEWQKIYEEKVRELLGRLK